MVAKTYQSYAVIDEPFTENGRQYVNINKNGAIKKVRWYTDAEYDRMYSGRREYMAPKPLLDKTALGFANGWIVLLKGSTPQHEKWMEHTKACRYARPFGWYIPSTEKMPVDLPSGIQTNVLHWDKVKHCTSESEVRRVING